MVDVSWVGIELRAQSRVGSFNQHRRGHLYLSIDKVALFRRSYVAWTRVGGDLIDLDCSYVVFRTTSTSEEKP